MRWLAGPAIQRASAPLRASRPGPLFGVDVAAGPGCAPGRAPVGCHLAGAVWCAEGVVFAVDHQGREGQRWRTICRQGASCGGRSARAVSGGATSRAACHAFGVLGVRGPGRHQMAAQAVGHQHGRVSGRPAGILPAAIQSPRRGQTQSACCTRSKPCSASQRLCQWPGPLSSQPGSSSTRAGAVVVGIPLSLLLAAALCARAGMAFKVFVDGQEGTTGLRIHEYLARAQRRGGAAHRPDKRKDNAERARLLNAADVAFLCLPDAASREAAALVSNPAPASSTPARRTAPHRAGSTACPNWRPASARRSAPASASPTRAAMPRPSSCCCARWWMPAWCRPRCR
jgi:hypothetical protein